MLFLTLLLCVENIPFSSFGETGNVPNTTGYPLTIVSNDKSLSAVLFNSSFPTCNDADLGSPN